MNKLGNYPHCSQLLQRIRPELNDDWVIKEDWFYTFVITEAALPKMTSDERTRLIGRFGPCGTEAEALARMKTMPQEEHYENCCLRRKHGEGWIGAWHLVAHVIPDPEDGENIFEVNN